jgi:hypothetical protein
MRTAIMAGALMALSITTAGAQINSLSANAILPGCAEFAAMSKYPDHPVQAGTCLGIVTTLILILQSETEGPFCIEFPRGATFMLAVQVVIGYVQAQPKRMHELFAVLAHEALLDAWPCTSSDFDSRFRGK